MCLVWTNSGTRRDDFNQDDPLLESAADSDGDDGAGWYRWQRDGCPAIGSYGVLACGRRAGVRLDRLVACADLDRHGAADGCGTGGAQTLSALAAHRICRRLAASSRSAMACSTSAASIVCAIQIAEARRLSTT